MPTRVFWPGDALRRIAPNEQSIVVGWRNSANDYVVTVVLPFLDVTLAERLLEHDMLVKHTKRGKSARELYKRYGGNRLQVLATCNHFQKGCYFQVRTTGSDLPAIELPGDDDVQLIVYDPPNANWMHYLSIEPIQLDLSETSTFTIVSAEYERDLVKMLRNRQQMIANTALHAGSRKPGPDILDQCISQINCSHELAGVLASNARQVFPEIVKQPHMTRTRRLSMSAQRLKNEATRQASQQAERLGLVTLLKWALLGLVMGARLLAEGGLRLLELPVAGYTLRDVSATALQIDLRLKNIVFLPDQYCTIRRHQETWSTPELSIEYIRFYNGLWLMANDLILGLAVGGTIMENRSTIYSAIEYATQRLFGDFFKSMMSWLMAWPAGLKLNNELARFFGEVFMWVIVSWQRAMLQASPLLKAMVVVIGSAGFGGLTLQISLLCDLISLLTFHIYCLYLASSKIYRRQLIVLASLFRLFRGKKFNVLRSRVDSGDYDLSQLLLGTLLFTALLFLLPTVAIFYLAFAFSRIVLVLVCAVLEMALAFLNHFPLFVLLLRVKSPGRVPGGLHFELAGDGAAGASAGEKMEKSESATSVLHLTSQPISVDHIFHQYNVVAQRFARHYFSISVIMGLLTGRLVTIQRSKLYSLLYSMLPKQRRPSNQLYGMLRETYGL